MNKKVFLIALTFNLPLINSVYCEEKVLLSDFSMGSLEGEKDEVEVIIEEGELEDEEEDDE